MWLLATYQIHFHISRVEVSQKHIFNFQSNEGEGGDLRSCNNLVLILMRKLILHLVLQCSLFLLARSEVHVFCSLLGVPAFDLTGSLPLALVLAAGPSSVWFSSSACERSNRFPARRFDFSHASVRLFVISALTVSTKKIGFSALAAIFRLLLVLIKAQFSCPVRATGGERSLGAGQPACSCVARLMELFPAMPIPLVLHHGASRSDFIVCFSVSRVKVPRSARLIRFSLCRVLELAQESLH
jgi:hypothetical protein